MTEGNAIFNGRGKWLLSWALTALQPTCLVRRELLHYGAIRR